MSKSATVWSVEPVARSVSLKGLKARQLISCWWASTLCAGPDEGGLRVSQMSSCLSSPTLPKRCTCFACHATSSTTLEWPL